MLGHIADNWAEISAVVSTGLLIGGAVKAKQWVKALKATAKLCTIVVSAIEDADVIAKREKDVSGGEKLQSLVKTVKRTVKDNVEAQFVKDKDTALLDAQAAIIASTQPVKEGRGVPPVKRFWRRLLKGQNFAGVASRMILKSALSEALSKGKK